MSYPLPKSVWRWFGNHGHFICGRWCRFHLCTQVGPWVVSTVGEYVHPRHSAGSEQAECEWLKDNFPGEEIGAGRKYETMVFKTVGGVCDCGCEMPKVDWSEIDAQGYMTAAEATAGHMELCQKWASTPKEAA